ncbi:MAG: RT0821/Lpp0805 family surface protein [Acetobacteraceae bacterium]
MRASIAILPALLLLAVTPPAHAQQFPPFGTRLGPGLKGDDLAIVTNVTDALNAAGTKDSKTWSNPKTSTSGTISLIRDFHSAGMGCHELKYLFDFTRPARHRTYTLNWCRTAAGEWKIKS